MIAIADPLLDTINFDLDDIRTKAGAFTGPNLRKAEHGVMETLDDWIARGKRVYAWDGR